MDDGGLVGNSGFEVFTGRAVATPHPPLYATFQKRGLLTLNRAAFQALGEPEAVELLFNRYTKSVGIRPTGLGHNWSYKLRREERSGMFKLSVAAFRRHYGLPDVTVAMRYRATLQGDMLAIDLNQEPVITGRDPNADVAF